MSTTVSTQTATVVSELLAQHARKVASMQAMTVGQTAAKFAAKMQAVQAAMAEMAAMGVTA